MWVGFALFHINECCGFGKINKCNVMFFRLMNLVVFAKTISHKCQILEVDVKHLCFVLRARPFKFLYRLWFLWLNLFFVSLFWWKEYHIIYCLKAAGRVKKSSCTCCPYCSFLHENKQQVLTTIVCCWVFDIPLTFRWGLGNKGLHRDKAMEDSEVKLRVFT